GMRGAGTWAVLYPSEFAYANGAVVIKDGKLAINSKEAVEALAWYVDLALKHKVTPPSAATDGFVEIVETFGRGVTSMYQHNSGSVGQQKRNVGVSNFATLPLPIGPARTRASFYFSETLTMLKGARNKEGAWQFMSFMLDDEPSLMYCKTLGLLPGTPIHHLEAGVFKRSGAERLRRVFPDWDSQPVSRLPRLGRQDRFRWR